MELSNARNVAVKILKLQEAELKLKRMGIDLELIIIMLKQKGECPTEQEIKEGFKIGIIEGQISL